MSKRVWKPLPDGKYKMPAMQPYILHVCYGGAELEEWFPGDEEHAQEISIQDYRLCQLVDDTDNGARGVPVEIADAIEELGMAAAEMGKGYEQAWARVRAWLTEKEQRNATD